MLLSMLIKESPHKLLIAFDEGEATFRHIEHTEYKAGRAETPDDFYPQLPRVKELLSAFGVVHVSDPRYEADDFLCAYAKAAEKEGMKVTIVTGDRDAFQLASDNIRIAIPHKGYQEAEYLDPAGVMTKLGVRPDQVPAYKGIAGDNSDNLPGVRGIGPKGAADLLKKYDTLENIYNHLDEIKPVMREKLERDKEQAFFCERMAQLICDIDLPVSLKDLSLSGLSGDRVLEFFQTMNFTLLSKRFIEFLKTDTGKRIFTASEAVFVEPPKKGEKTKDQLSLF